MFLYADKNFQSVKYYTLVCLQRSSATEFKMYSNALSFFYCATFLILFICALRLCTFFYCRQRKSVRKVNVSNNYRADEQDEDDLRASFSLQDNTPGLSTINLPDISFETCDTQNDTKCYTSNDSNGDCCSNNYGDSCGVDYGDSCCYDNDD